MIGEISYQRIITEYVDHVGRMEGIDYLGESLAECMIGDLTEEEAIELLRLRRKLYEDRQRDHA